MKEAASVGGLTLVSVIPPGANEPILWMSSDRPAQRADERDRTWGIRMF
jgi:hypothetical protein